MIRKTVLFNGDTRTANRRSSFFQRLSSGIISSLLLPLVLSQAISTQAEEPRNFILLCSPSLPKAERAELFMEFQRFSVEQMTSGDHCQVFNGVSLKPVAEFTMPAEAKTPKSRMRAAAGLIQSVQRFLGSPGGEDRKVNLPQFAAVYQQMVETAGAQVLVIGSALYHDEMPSNDMTQGWLGDGYLTQPVSVSLFSTVGRSESLRGAQVNYCILSEDCWATENKSAHREMTQRFWALYTQGLGGTLVSFQPSLSVAFHQLASASKKPVGQYKPDPKETEMIIHRSKVSTGAPVKQEAQPAARVEEKQGHAVVIDLAKKENKWMTLPAKAIQEAPKPVAKKLPPAAPMKASLVWKGEGIDLDLYAAPKSGAEELFFGHTHSSAGVHYKDFSSALPLYGFELVDFTADVKPSEVSLWVNVHHGSSSAGFAGEVRVLYAGSVHTYPFLIPAKEGNAGKDLLVRQNSPYWAKIDLHTLTDK